MQTMQDSCILPFLWLPRSAVVQACICHDTENNNLLPYILNWHPSLSKHSTSCCFRPPHCSHTSRPRCYRTRWRWALHLT